jgi:hypothetical protein
MAELGEAGEQSTEGLETVTEGELQSEGEQSVANQITETGSEELTFFDPSSIQGQPELEAAYKQMQRAFTEKTQAIASDRKKIEAYNAFEANPMATIQTLAQQYGYQLNPYQAQQQQQQEFTPETWEDVLKAADERAEKKYAEKFGPILDRVEKLQQSNVEGYLDQNYPDWRTYEDDMTRLVKEHPTLAKDPGTLYELALPRKVREARATKAALNKIQAGTGAVQVSGGSTINKQVSDTPKKGMSFHEAYEYARKQTKRG